jgi:hypothetical protein
MQPINAMFVVEYYIFSFLNDHGVGEATKQRIGDIKEGNGVERSRQFFLF